MNLSENQKKGLLVFSSLCGLVSTIIPIFISTKSKDSARIDVLEEKIKLLEKGE